jgi:hypothetical protein
MDGSDSKNDTPQVPQKKPEGGLGAVPVMFCQTAARPDKTTGEGAAPPSTPRRKRREKRRMSALMFFRCTPEERNNITVRATNAGIQLSSYLRIQALGKSKVRRYRRIRADWDELRSCMGIINRAGNVVNQLVKFLYLGGGYSSIADAALLELRRAAQAIVRALK